MTLLRTVFEQPDADAVHAQMRHVLDVLEAKFPKAAAHLDTAQHDLLAFIAPPCSPNSPHSLKTRSPSGRQYTTPADMTQRVARLPP